MINGEKYISLYLAKAKTKNNGIINSVVSALRGQAEVYATFRLSVFDHNQKNYFTVEDKAGALSRFESGTEIGFAKFLPLHTFQRHSEGFISNDSCTFGAEVFVSTNKRTLHRESLSLETPAIRMRTFRRDLGQFSTQFDMEYAFPQLIIVGGRKWQLCVYPKGYGKERNKSLSLYLRSADDLDTLPSVYAEFKVRVIDRSLKTHNTERRGNHWFSSSDCISGWPDFMPLRTLKGFLKGDILSVEVEMLAVSTSL
ncbi:hypothetical protein GBA52_007823 [Prunus armeniaca]|nr:hypothetical protein GBA52_007823 [Prunus armeniaca]